MKSWDKTWENIFENRVWGKYPPEELVRFIARNLCNVPDRKAVGILDLGCGTGACSWYIAREGFSIFGIDGSFTATKVASQRLRSEGLPGIICVGDFIDIPWSTSYFDCVIDVEALSCNTFEMSKIILDEIIRVLKPGGLLFSISFKDGCWGDGTGKKIEQHTYFNVTEGPCEGMGVIRFSPESEIRQLYQRFETLSLEYNLRTADKMNKIISQWVISGRKPY
jgi:ubiquinone/menaquinone biosynthesis C-methylase UbiE